MSNHLLRDRITRVSILAIGVPRQQPRQDTEILDKPVTYAQVRHVTDSWSIRAMSQICRYSFGERDYRAPPVLPAPRGGMTNGTIRRSGSLTMLNDSTHPSPGDAAGKRRHARVIDTCRSSTSTCIEREHEGRVGTRCGDTRITEIPFSTLVFPSPEATLGSTRGAHRTRCLPIANLYCAKPAAHAL